MSRKSIKRRRRNMRRGQGKAGMRGGRKVVRVIRVSTEVIE